MASHVAQAALAQETFPITRTHGGSVASREGPQESQGRTPQRSET
jgi:hypothetical protein